MPTTDNESQPISGTPNLNTPIISNSSLNPPLVEESRKAIIIKNKNTIVFNKDSEAPFTVAISRGNIGNKHLTLIGALLYKSKIEGIKRIFKINKDLINVEFEKFDQANN